ncbi:MAG: tryptophan-rich sensory protein [Betaproteobacteria bacterium]|nr:tryptophan-rich sensory protein [Betaproteobacteria bacterium]
MRAMTTSFSPPARQVPLKTKLTVIAAVVLVAMLGGMATDIGSWYLSLVQPWWKPPDWAFAPAWTLIFACTAVSAIGAWHAASRERERFAIGIGFAMNAFLNILWSVLFFKLQKPLWAAFEVFALWASNLLLNALRVETAGREQGRNVALINESIRQTHHADGFDQTHFA